MKSDKSLLIINLIIPVLMISLSLPLIYGKIPPNDWYGFRTPKTLSSDEMWYRTNKIGGKYFIVAAVFQLLAVAILIAWPGFDTSPIVWGVLPTAPLLIAVVAWFIWIRKF